MVYKLCANAINDTRCVLQSNSPIVGGGRLKGIGLQYKDY